MPEALVYDQIACDLDEFREIHGDPAGRLFRIEITRDAVTYVYAEVAAAVEAGKIVFELNDADITSTRRAH
jgi:hypothetical protein